MMKNIIIFFVLICIVFTGCTTMTSIPKSTAYKEIYNTKPLTILIMPPINRSTHVDAKEYFHSTLHIPIADRGYYVIPPYISMDILKRESAYDSELFIDASLEKFREVFGADIALFTIIHSWDKAPLAGIVTVQVEYIFKSIATSEVLYSRKGKVKYNASISTDLGGILGAVLDIALTAANTAATNYSDVARAANAYTLQDLPAGKYNPEYGTDGADMSGKAEFTVSLDKNYR